MPIEHALVVDMLKRIHLFRGVDDPKLDIVVGLLEEVDLPAGSVIFQEGDDPDYFYFIFNGQVRITRYNKQEGRYMQLGLLTDWDYFGEEVLESNWSRQISTETAADSVLFRITVPNFVSLLDVIPPLSQRLQFILESYQLMLNTHFAWQDPEETIYYIARRHRFFLWLNILPPTLIGSMAIFVMLFVVLKSGLALSMVALLFLVVLVVAAWWVWSYVDWTNDYYIVTNKRILYLEKVVLLYDSRQESPLEVVQSTSSNSTQWGRWLGYGNVAIRTFIGTILFRNVAMPENVMGLIQEHQVRAQITQYRSELSTIKNRIDDRINQGPKYPTPFKVSKPTVKPSAMQQFLSTMFHLRYEQPDGTVIFRTHWFILFQKIWIPTLLLIGLFLLFLYSASRQFSMISAQATCGLSIILGTVIFGWWFYQYIDWHNDIYIISNDQVIDVYKKPLGREERQAAPLRNILSIEYKRLGIIGQLLNFGTVFIRVGDQQLSFDDVFNPSEVQHELFQRLAKRTYQDRQAQADIERQRLADWIATYNEWQNRRPSSHP